jgi:hypothetical protein
MNHVDPSTSSGSSPGATPTTAPQLHHIPASDSQLISFDVDAPEGGDCAIRTCAWAKSLIVNKRKLPVVLRNEVPKIRVAGTAVEPLVVTPNRLRGVLHSAVGKQIQHRGQAVTILSVHQNTRLVVRVGEEEHGAFWVPRRAEDRRNFKQQRTRRIYHNQIKIAFPSPTYTGDVRPNSEVVRFPQWEKLISQELYDFATQISQLLRFGKHGGRCRLILKSFHEEFASKLQAGPPTRREHKLLERKTRQKYAALKRRLQERLLRQIIADTRLSEDKQFAVYDVMALGQPLEQVAVNRQVSVGSLENTVRRTTTRVNQAYEATLQQWAGAEILP